MDAEQENVEKTLVLFDDIYKIVKDPRFMKEFDADSRHRILMQKYKDIANMYPVVLRIMARDLRYNRNAMRLMLNKMISNQKKVAAERSAQTQSTETRKPDPLSAMRAFITHQADYAKFLYMEETKKAGRHIDMNKARNIWQIEYGDMNKALKKIKDDEDKARNEFEDEKKNHLDERRKELLDFIMENAPEVEPEPKAEPVVTDELTELDNYIKDLGEAKRAFAGDIMPGISNEDLEEYSNVLNYCGYLFGMAVKHDKLTEDRKRELDADVAYCTQRIEDEVARRNKIALADNTVENDDNEWIKDHIQTNKKHRTKKSSKK